MAPQAKILEPTPENIAIAAEAIGRGEVVGMPTETVYGLAGGAFQPDALARIFDTKERPTFDPLIIHVGPLGKGCHELARIGLIDLARLTEPALSRAEALIRAFWPGPLTLVLPKSEQVPDLATSGLPTVAVRMPRHPVAQQLIALAGTPLAAPSANRFGRISPTTARHVLEELGDRISWILDGGPCEVGLESTVVAVEPSGVLALLRPGGTPRDQIEKVAGAQLLVERRGPEIAAPGMLESHYAPSKPLRILPGALSTLVTEDVTPLLAGISPVAPLGLLMISGDAVSGTRRLTELSGHPVVTRSLSRAGDLYEAARGLFAEMRVLDASDAALILAEPSPTDHGLGHAIADRLKRASARL